jgi:hypothetical protein
MLSDLVLTRTPVVDPIVGIDRLAPVASFLATQDCVGIRMRRKLPVRPKVAVDAPAAYKPAPPLGAVTDQHAVGVDGFDQAISGGGPAYTESFTELIHGIEGQRLIARKRGEKRLRH